MRGGFADGQMVQDGVCSRRQTVARMDRLKPFGLVYLATPYTKYPMGHEIAFRHAAKLAAKLVAEKINVYSPIAHTHPIAIHGGLDNTDYHSWISFDKAMMNKADTIVVGMMPSWEQSYGISYEVGYFRAQQKPVFYLDPDTLELTDAPVSQD